MLKRAITVFLLAVDALTTYSFADENEPPPPPSAKENEISDEEEVRKDFDSDDTPPRR